MNQTSLERALADFQAKKESGAAFLADAAALRADFDAAFPEFSKGGDDRFNLEKINACARKIADEKLKILFAGQFKTGKSTLINAILGREVLPANVMPCTAVITEIEYGETPACTLHFKKQIDALPEGLNPQIAAHLAEHGLENAPPLELALDDPQLLNECLTIDIGKEHAQGVRETPLAKCVLRWPLPLCANGAVLIDSPGLNEAEARDRTTLGYLASADVIVHVLMALQFMGAPDKEFMDTARKIGNLPIIFAVNRFDNLNTDRDREQLRAAALRHPQLLDAAYGEAGIFFTSGEMALRGREKNDPQMLSASGLPALEDKIGEIFAEDRARIKLSALGSICDDLHIYASANLPDLGSKLGMDADALKNEYDEREAEFQALAAKIDHMRQLAKRCLDNFSDEFCMAAENYLRAFASGPMAQIVEQTEISAITMLNCKEDTQTAVEQLSAACWSAMKDGIMSWLNSQGAAICAKWREDLAREIHADMESFNHSLSLLRRHMDFTPLDLPRERVDINLDVFLPQIGNVGMAVGGVGAGLVLVGERFIPMLIGGPLGWGLAIAATIASLVWAACTGNEKAQAKVKTEFLQSARKILDGEIPRLAQNLTLDARDLMRDEIWPLFAGLQRELDDVRRPIESALAILGQRRQNVDAKKERLAQFVESFRKLDARGQELLASF